LKKVFEILFFLFQKHWNNVFNWDLMLNLAHFLTNVEIWANSN
jgi:hypothetical protein